MAQLFEKRYAGVLDKLSCGWEANADVENSNFLGIGKKAKARKAAKKNVKFAERKYKLETDRVRAMQGMQKETVLGNVVKGVTSVATALVGGKQASEDSAAYEDPNLGSSGNQGYYPPAPTPKSTNTLLIIAAVATVLVIVFILVKKK